MIVKDEAHIITETLETVYKYIDYYVISDTGSTDDTINVIKNFFIDKNIPGEIYQNKWTDFGYNRTLALKLAKDKSDYIWIIDADDIVVGDFIIPELTQDSYFLTYGKHFQYDRKQIFKNDLEWEYVGVLHEYPRCKNKEDSTGKITGDYYVDSRRLGARSKDPNKYLKDAQVLVKALESEPDNQRYVFYAAQSYFDHGDYINAIKYYQQRVKMEHWKPEVYYSLYKIGMAYEHLGKNENDIENAYLDAWKHSPHRSEPLYQLALYFRSKNSFEKGYRYALKGVDIPIPQNDTFFVSTDVYKFKLKDEVAISGYYVEQYDEAIKCCYQLLKSKDTPQHFFDRVKSNMIFSFTKLYKHKPNLLLHFGFHKLSSFPNIFDTINTLTKFFDVHIYAYNFDIDIENDITLVHHKIIKNIVKECQYVLMFDNINMLFENINLDDKNILLVKHLDSVVVNMKYFDIVVKDKNILNDLKIVDCEIYSILYHIHSQIGSVELNISNNSFEPFEFKFSKKIKYLMDHHTVYNHQFICHIFNKIKHYVYMPEIFIELAKYFINAKEYVAAIEQLTEALKFDRGTHIQNIIHYYTALIFHKMEKYQGSFNLLTFVLKQNITDEKLVQKLVHVRDLNVPIIMKKCIEYPEKRVNEIVEHVKSIDNVKIMLTITTCKRVDLFVQSINSFINKNHDYLNIDRWLCIDDNSSQKDIDLMKSKYPFFEFILKDEIDKGHWKSMNIIIDEVKKCDCEYLLHIEDDWLFFEDMYYVGDAIKIFNHDNRIKQVLFNKNYYEIEPSKKNIIGGFKKFTDGGLKYILHQHYDPNSHEYKDFYDRNKNKLTTAYWPYYSFRPSVIKTEIFNVLGFYYNSDFFELDYAKEFTERGYLSAFFDTFCSYHLGKKTWEKNGVNAYKLNDQTQFHNVNHFTFVVSRDLDEWKYFKNSARDKLPYYSRSKIDYVYLLNKDVKKLFTDNTYQYHRKIVYEMYNHYTLWKNSKCFLVIDEQCRFKNEFDFDEIKKTFDKHEFDIMILGHNFDFNNDGISELNQIGEIYHFAYLVSENGKKKLINYIEKNGLKYQLWETINRCFDKIHIVNKSLFSIGVKDNLTLPELTGYKFYSLMDSFGYDIKHYSNKNLTELKNLADNSENCKGFNTLGWVKFQIGDLDPIDHISKDCNVGLFIKI